MVVVAASTASRKAPAGVRYTPPARSVHLLTAAVAVTAAGRSTAAAAQGTTAGPMSWRTFLTKFRRIAEAAAVALAVVVAAVSTRAVKKAWPRWRWGSGRTSTASATGLCSPPGFFRVAMALGRRSNRYCLVHLSVRLSGRSVALSYAVSRFVLRAWLPPPVAVALSWRILSRLVRCCF